MSVISSSRANFLRAESVSSATGGRCSAYSTAMISAHPVLGEELRLQFVQPCVRPQRYGVDTFRGLRALEILRRRIAKCGGECEEFFACGVGRHGCAE